MNTPTICPVTNVEKPWGGEVIFAAVEGRFVGKVLTIRAGHSLSLQYHERKEEVIALAQGAVRLRIGTHADDLRDVELEPGHAVHIPPLVWHQVTALTDAVLWEASTADPGWTHDVTRISDEYGREGSNHP